MSRLLKSRGYLMKCLGFVLLFVFISLGAIGGCNNDGDELSQITQALTENDFSSDPSLRADPEKHLIVYFLEHPDSEKPENDTGEVGKDRIPHTYTRTLNHTLCWEDDDADAEHFMVIEDSEGNEIFRLDVNGECITVVLEAGDYVMIINHDGRIEKTHPIFIIPGRNGEQEAQKIDTNEGLLKSAKSLFSKILNNLHNIITQTTNAQTPTPTPSANLTTLLKTNMCQGCNLMGVDLSGKDLTEAILTGAILTDAILTDAVLTGAILTRAILTRATWCDGSICPDPSIGICKTGARFMDNCDGTITDTVEIFQNETFKNLMWEKKVDGPAGSCLDDDKLHSVDATCNWFNATGAWITKLNNTCNNDPTVDCTTGGDADCIVSDCCGFACHSDWRLPEVDKDEGTAEFDTIVDCSFGSPCIDPIFGPTAALFYWSATLLLNDPNGAWLVNFFNGGVTGDDKNQIDHVRAVRP